MLIEGTIVYANRIIGNELWVWNLNINAQILKWPNINKICALVEDVRVFLLTPI